MLCNSFIIAGLLDLSAFPGFVPSRFFLPNLPSRVFRRDPIYNDLVLFRLLASGMTRTHYLL